VSFCVLIVCKCVLYYCDRVATVTVCLTCPTLVTTVVYVGKGLDFHHILYRQILQVKGRIAFRWVVLCCHQSDYLSDKRTPRQYNKIVLLYILNYYVHNIYSGNEEISSQINS